LISRYGSYHGATLAGASVSGKRARDWFHYPLLPGCLHVGAPTGRDDHVRVDELEEKIHQESPDTIAAFIAEPIAFLEFRIPEPIYWRRIREVCTDNNILLIVDETMTGWCRTGKTWAIDHWGVEPDILITGKSLTAGYAPMAAMVTKPAILDVLPADQGFPMILSWGGHAVSAAAVNLALEVYERDRMSDLATARGAQLVARLKGVGDSPIVKDIRSLGFWLAVELMDDHTGESLTLGTSRTEPWSAMQMIQYLLDARCASSRMSEGVLQVCPPLVATEEDLEFVARAVEDVIERMELAIKERRRSKTAG
jgi:taurine-pyruvate aminotransferase